MTALPPESEAPMGDCPKKVYNDGRDYIGHRCARKTYQPEDGQPSNEHGECKLHYNVRHQIGARYDAQRAERERNNAKREGSRDLIEALGCGKADLSFSGTPTGGVRLTAEEASALIARLPAAPALPEEGR